MRVVIFDPSRRDHSGSPTINLGDIIIRRSVDTIITELFPQAEMIRLSTHQVLERQMLQKARHADIVLVAGTNLLSSHVLEYDQWKLAQEPQFYADPLLLNAVLLGVGWWQYQDEPDIITRHYYRRILHPTLPHSVRDSYTRSQLARCRVTHALNTSCPTLWTLDGHSVARVGRNRKCLFCLTDYNRLPEEDGRFIDLLLEEYEDLIFFPQGNGDMEYAASLPSFANAGKRITSLPHSVEALYETVERGGIDYIGTRLHTGALCLQYSLPSLILSIDNRSTEIAKDVNLPVVPRGDERAIREWLAGGPPHGTIRLPMADIAAWKDQVRKYAAEREASGNGEVSPTDDRSGCSVEKDAPTHGNLWQRLSGLFTHGSPLDGPQPQEEGGGRNPSRLLNLGCGKRAHPAWVNVDFSKTLPGVIAHNLLTPLPFADKSFDVVYHSHVVEHMPRQAAIGFLKECARVLRPGGIIRVVMPDLELLVRLYLQSLTEIDAGDASAHARHEYVVINMFDQAVRHKSGGQMLEYWKRKDLDDFVIDLNGLEVLQNLVHLQQHGSTSDVADSALTPGELQRETVGAFRLSGEPHLWMYDRVSLKRLLEQAGFTGCICRSAQESAIENFVDYCLDTTATGDVYKPESLFMEATAL